MCTLTVAHRIGDLILCTSNKDLGVKALPVSDFCDDGHSVMHTLLGCIVCNKPNSHEFADAGSMKYTFDTVYGDCGRPYVFWDENVFRLQGIHTFAAWKGNKYNRASRFFKYNEILESAEEIGYINRNMATITSRFVPDLFARKYLDKYNLVSYDNYELKEINLEVYQKGIDKYNSRPDWSLPDNDPRVIMTDAIFKKLWAPYSKFTPVEKKVLLELLRRDGTGTLNHSSPGYPWTMLDRDKVVLLEKQIHALWQGMESGSIMEMPVLGTVLPKDEVRAILKDIRFILAMPIHHTAVGAHLFGGHFSQYKDDCTNGRNPCCIGMDLNVDIDDLYSGVLGFDSKSNTIERTCCFSGDFDACDTSMSSWIIQHVADIVEKWLPENKRDLFKWYTHHAIYTMMRYPPNLIYQKTGGMPSGFFNTGDWNTKDCNWITIYTIVSKWWDDYFSKMTIAEGVKFYEDNVREKHAGDDFLVVLSKLLAMTREDFAKHLPYGVSVTFDFPGTDCIATNSTMLSMRPTCLEARDGKLKVDAVHNKLERVFVKMAFKDRKHNDTVFYQKVCNAIIWAWFDYLTRDKLFAIKGELEEYFTSNNMNYVKITNEELALRKGFFLYE